MEVDERKDVNQRLEYAVHGCLALCVLPHPPEEHPFIASVGEYKEVRVTVDGGQELLEYLSLQIWIVGPEREALFRIPIADDHADQIIEPLFGVAFDVEIDTDRSVRKVRRAEQIDPSVPDRESLQGVIAVVVPWWGPLPLRFGRNVWAS